MSIFQNVDWVALLVVVVGLVVIFAIVNVRLRLSLLRREAKQLSQDVMRLTTWAEDRRLNQLDSATKKRRTNTSCSLTSIAVLHHSRLTAMRKFLGPEGEVEALRTFDYPNQNADRRITLWRTSVTGLFATPTARCRSPPRPISRDTTGLRGFGWRKGC